MRADAQNRDALAQVPQEQVGGFTLPPGITAETASGILFVGRVAWLRRKLAGRDRSPTAATAADAGRRVGKEAGQAIAHMLQADEFDAPQFSRLVASLRAQVGPLHWPCALVHHLHEGDCKVSRDEIMLTGKIFGSDSAVSARHQSGHRQLALWAGSTGAVDRVDEQERPA